MMLILTLGVFGILNTEMGVVGIIPIIAETFGVTVLDAGWTVSLFALIIALGLVAEFADQTHTARHILWYEDAGAAGGILGNLISIYQFPLPFGEAGAGIFGIFAGVFVGAWAMALTEIINIIPIFARRLDFRRGLELLIVSMALGRTAGSLIFYYFGF